MKRYCVAERWIVEDRYYVDADNETEACKKILDIYSDESECIEVIETIVEEIPDEVANG